MDAPNHLSTPRKSKRCSFFQDSSDSNISAISPQNSPISYPRNRGPVNVSSDELQTSHSNGQRVTSTPVSRNSTLETRKSLSHNKRYSLKPDNDVKRVDIIEQVRAMEDNRSSIESLRSDIFMNHLKFQNSRLNTIDRDFAINEAYIYLYPAFFNSDLMESKFLLQSQVTNLSFLDHRYDSDTYAVKIGNKSNNNFLSLLNQRLIHEIRILKRLGNHPHVVEYCDSWLEDERLHLQLTQVSGGSLRNLLLARGQEMITDNSGTFMTEGVANVLLAQMGSVLAYMHDVFRMAHGAISTNHILVDLIGCSDGVCIETQCREALRTGDRGMSLRFKLCDFVGCRPPDSTIWPCESDGIECCGDNCSRDMLMLGLVLYESFSGVNPSLVYNNWLSNMLELPANISEQWCSIIRNLSHKEPQQRWTARQIITLDTIDKLILPEARSYLPNYNSEWINTAPLNFLTRFTYDNTCHLSSLFNADNYWIQSDTDGTMVDITTAMKTIAHKRQNTAQHLTDIYNQYLKFKDKRLGNFSNKGALMESGIFDYPVLFNSDVMSSKFSSQTLISNNKLSTIYLVDHRFDGDRYIVKVGLQSPTVAISDSSREIINEMRILKLIGKHVNVVGYCDCWIEQERFHLQLPYVAGGSLYDFTQGHDSQLYALSDTVKRKSKLTISSQSAYVLLAHMIAVLVYLHNDLRVFHGDIKPSNILVELTDEQQQQLIAGHDWHNAKLHCHRVLANEQVNMALRFRLCDFGRSGPTENISFIEEGDGRYLSNLSEAESDYHFRGTTRDIFALGVSIYDCFGGIIDQEASRDIRLGAWPDWPDNISMDWRHIIMNLSHAEANERWTASQVIVHDRIQAFILPEAKYHLPTTDRYVSNIRPIKADTVAQDTSSLFDKQMPNNLHFTDDDTFSD